MLISRHFPEVAIDLMVTRTSPDIIKSKRDDYGFWDVLLAWSDTFLLYNDFAGDKEVLSCC